MEGQSHLEMSSLQRQSKTGVESLPQMRQDVRLEVRTMMGMEPSGADSKMCPFWNHRCVDDCALFDWNWDRCKIMSCLEQETEKNELLMRSLERSLDGRAGG